jgi:predicted permease
MRYLLTESLIIAVLGGVVGLIFCYWLSQGLVRFLPFDPANLSLSARPDLRVLSFTAAITILTALIFGIVPALQGSRVSPGATLKDEANAVTGSRAHVRLRKILLTAEVGLSCLLLIGAGLFARTLQNLRHVNLGFQTENVATFGVRPATVYGDARKLQIYRSLIERLAAVPGVRAVGANRSRLLTAGRWDSNVTIPGARSADGNDPWSYFNAVTPGYFEALGIPIKAGRDISWRDWGSSRKLCLVNEALVNEYFAGVNPVGRRMAQGVRQPTDLEIIGVFGNARYEEVRGAIPRQTFVALDYKMENVSGVTVYARIQGDPRLVLPQLRAEVRRLDPNLVVSDMRMLDEQLNMRLSHERMLSFLSTAFAVLATLLAVVGLHGVLSFVVARRTREIGIRVALGAQQGSVIRLVLREMLPAIFIGIAAGITTGLLCGRYVESQLFGVKAGEPLIFIMSAGTLLAASTAAAFIPAWRACRIDPIQAIRYE